LNDSRQVVDFNPSAGRIFPGLTRRRIGQRLGDALRASTEAVVSCSAPEVGATPGRAAKAGGLDRGAGDCADLGADVLLRGSVVTVKHRDGAERHYSVASTTVLGRGGRCLGNAVVFHDVTGGIDQLERVRRLADTDDLTGFLTRRRFLELSRHEMARARRHALPVAIMVLDLDGFKAVNDRHGHIAGDRLLRAVAEVCRQQLRPHDLVGRYGGDELCVLMPQTPAEDGELVAGRLRESIADATVAHNGTSLRITVSIGVAGVGVVTDQTLESLLEDADRELYAAKRRGRDRVSVRSA
jgi:diguanylate cyclase (GGDEF)-like protein